MRTEMRTHPLKVVESTNFVTLRSALRSLLDGIYLFEGAAERLCAGPGRGGLYCSVRRKGQKDLAVAPPLINRFRFSPTRQTAASRTWHRASLLFPTDACPSRSLQCAGTASVSVRACTVPPRRTPHRTASAACSATSYKSTVKVPLRHLRRVS